MRPFTVLMQYSDRNSSSAITSLCWTKLGGKAIVYPEDLNKNTTKFRILQMMSAHHVGDTMRQWVPAPYCTTRLRSHLTCLFATLFNILGSKGRKGVNGPRSYITTGLTSAVFRFQFLIDDLLCRVKVHHNCEKNRKRRSFCCHFIPMGHDRTSTLGSITMQYFLIVDIHQ